jgi:carboxypeptidase Q
MASLKKPIISYFFYVAFSLLPYIVQAQNNTDDDAKFISSVHEFSLSKSECYAWLKSLCLDVGNRLSGSIGYKKAVALTSQQLKSIPSVTVFTQDAEVDVWQRGIKEVVEAIPQKGKKIKLNALAIGLSVGTGSKGIRAEVIEVQSLEEVDRLGREKISGKIVFYNRPMPSALVSTRSAYGQSIEQRGAGASRAAKYGAVGVIVRSLTTQIDDFPHTGALRYLADVPKIPAICISTLAAENLSALMKNQKVDIFMKNTSSIVGKSIDQSVIAEIKGSLHPEKIILVGGHLDSWDPGQGAHDDGAGCVQSMEVLHTLIALGYKPKHTIRCVLFANEEIGLAGGNEYARLAKQNNEIHIAAIESDGGGHVPRGFTFEADTSVIKPYFQKISKIVSPLLEPYDLTCNLGGSGADIGPLRPQKALLVGLKADSNRYFDFHHTSRDTYDAVHPRELQLGAAAMTSLVYLIDKYGL